MLYILKDTRNGKFDAKSDEGIFPDYSTKIKAYKCLNSNTNKIVESVNVKIDEYVERNEADSKREPEDYRSFVYIEEEEEASNKLAPDAESQVSNAKRQTDAAEYQENSAEREQEPVELQENAAEHQDEVGELSEVEYDNIMEEPDEKEERRVEPILAKYVRRHHKPEQIIGDKDTGIQTRSKTKDPTCLLCEFKPKTTREALENEDWIEAMNEEIDQIVKNDTWTLVPRP